MRKIKLTLWGILIIGLSSLTAQDFQFSQIGLSEILHHPTASVLQPNPKQISIAYRSEKLREATLSNLFFQYNHQVKDFNFGLTAVRSTAGPGSLEATRLALQGNYQRVLNENEDALTVGFRFGMLQRTWQDGSFQFDRQYVQGAGWDASLESGESFGEGNVLVPIIDAGLLFRKYFDRFEANFGLSLNTINQPKTTLVDGMAMHYPMQLSFFTRVSLLWNERLRGDFYLSHNRLQTFSETRVGLLARYSVKDQTDLLFGIANRFGDAMIFQAGIGLNGLDLSLSYDLGHQQLPGSKGVLEVSAIYQFKEKVITNHRHIR